MPHVLLSYVKCGEERRLRDALERQEVGAASVFSGLVITGFGFTAC